MTTYKQDLNLPSHGKRAKAENAGTIRVKISRSTGQFLTADPEGFEFYLNICPGQKMYNATVENEDGIPPKKQVTPVEVPNEVLEEVVKLASDKTFMSIKNDDIIPDMMMMDTDEVQIKVKSDIGSVSLDSNMLDDTLLNGFLPTSKGDFDTPIHELASIACEKLGIELKGEFEDEDNE